jgi:membrane-bound ClpP family serine protease
MSELLSNLNGLEILYLICATTGGLFFAFRMVLLFMGLDHDGADGDILMDTDAVDAHHTDSDIGFKVLTIQGLTSFFMMFGLVGFALYREIGTGAFISVIGATAAGSATVWVIVKLFTSMKKLQSSGTIDASSAIGGEGTVYLTIPAGGTGLVQVSFQNHFREYDAVSQNKEEIKTGERIRVTWAKGNVLVVEKID